MLLYELLGKMSVKMAVPFIQSPSLERNLFCVCLEGYRFDSFSWRMLDGKYKMETENKEMPEVDNVTEGCCFSAKLAVAVCAMQTYLHLFIAKKG